MQLSKPQDAIHRQQIYLLLIEIADDPFLAQNLIFKGGTCAALLGRLDRFSVDIDFDLLPGAEQKEVDNHFKKIFKTLDLTIKDESQRVLQYHLKYKTPPWKPLTRQILKLDAVNIAYKNDHFSPHFLADIDRYLLCHDIETMFAHKLIALLNRYDKKKSIAARDLYDIHHFFMAGYSYNSEIILERTGDTHLEYLKKVINFIRSKVTQRNIDQNLNFLLDPVTFKKLRKILKLETISLIKDEINRQI